MSNDNYFCRYGFDFFDDNLKTDNNLAPSNASLNVTPIAEQSLDAKIDVSRSNEEYGNGH